MHTGPAPTTELVSVPTRGRGSNHAGEGFAETPSLIFLRVGGEAVRPRPPGGRQSAAPLLLLCTVLLLLRALEQVPAGKAPAPQPFDGLASPHSPANDTPPSHPHTPPRLSGQAGGDAWSSQGRGPCEQFLQNRPGPNRQAGGTNRMVSPPPPPPPSYRVWVH